MCKKLIYLIPIVLVLSMASTTSADLVAHWQFDDGSGTTAVDSSGNGHDGTLLLDPLWVAGKYSGALEFAGLSGQRVEMEGYEGILGTQDRTVMAWVKTTELGDWISWGQNVNTQKWIGRFNDNENNGQVGALRTECSGGYIISSTVLTDGEWHHVTSVLESDGSPTIEDIKMYVDGGLEAISGFRPVDVNTVGGRNVWIGDGHHDRPLLSVIDDVRIYDNAMTKLEIVAAKENIERVDMEIGFAVPPPVIDGEVDEIWAAASIQNFVPLEDPANASGSWQVLYDSENLYVIVDVTDDSLQNDSAGSWQDDSVELYLDGGNTKVDTPLSGDDHQYTFGWTTDEIQGTNVDGYTEGIEHAQVDTATGWRIEIKLPWLSIQGAAPMAGDLIGIDCYYNDDDDGGDSREGKMLSFSVEEFWNNASGWGTAVLAADKRVDVTAPGDVVQGVPNDGETTGGGDNGWPGAETPDLAVDDDVTTKYLHFKGEVESTGFQIELASGASIVTGLTFTTANDAIERDPISFELSGSNDSIDGPYTLIASGDIVDFAQEVEWPRFTMNTTPISFENDVAYKYYQIMFPTVRDPGAANSMQIAEVELLGPPGPVGHWKLDDGEGVIAVDSSGNGNDGTLEDGPTVVEGQIGQALAFDGSRVVIPASDSLTADQFQGSFTMTAWINPKRTGNTWQQIFRSVTASATNDTLFINNDGRLSWRGTVGGAWAGGMCETAPDVAPADQWTHVAVVGDGTNFRIYVNGALSEESAFQTTDGENTTYYIGGDTNLGESYAGMIDDVRIYDRALSEAEIIGLAGN